MRVASLPLVLQTVLLSIVLPAVGHSADMGKTAFHRHRHHAHFAETGETAFHRYGLQAKIQFCTECHGVSARGFRGHVPIPQLAGQQVQYLENQFKALAEHRRDNPVAKRFMVPVVQSIDPAMRTAIAEHFSALKPRPAGGGPKNLVEQGKKIFAEGVPDENIPACSACHGEDGKGSDMVPRIAGQMYAYTVAQLSGWGKGYRAKDPVSAENVNTMQPIASSMTKEQIAAVAAYVSRLDWFSPKTGIKSTLSPFLSAIEAAVGALDAMHEPAILALADTGLVTGTIRLALADMLKNVESALAAGLSGIPEKQERQPSNHSQQTLLDAFAEKYLDLTGESPTVSKASKHRDNRHL